MQSGQPHGGLPQRTPFQLHGDTHIVIGDGLTSQGSQEQFTGGSHLPFQAAMTALAEPGQRSGTVEVLPGLYVFDAPVEIAAAGLRLHGGANARIVAGAALVGACLRVADGADDVTVEGLFLEDVRDPPPAGATLLEVRADRFALLGCRIARTNRHAPAQRSIAVGLGAPGDGVEGALLQGNRFLVGTLGHGSSIPTIDEAEGVCLLASHGGSGLRLLANSFESALASSATPLAKLETAVALVDERDALLQANSLSFLAARVPGTTQAGALIDCSASGAAGAGPRLSFSGNFCEQLLCSSALRVAGAAGAPAHAVVSSNVFGRIGEVLAGGVRLEHAAGSVLTGNNFHIVGEELQVAPAVRVVDSDGSSLQGNTFSMPQGRQVWISSSAGVLIAGNRFAGAPTQAGETHLHLDDVAEASIVHNSFSPQHCPSIAFSDASGAGSAFVCGNTFPVGCGASASPWSTSGTAVAPCDTQGPGGNPSF